MSFDDLIRIFLILFFVVIPIMRAISRNQQKPPAPGRPQQPPAGRQTPQAGPLPKGETSTPVSTAEAEFQKKLDEARRRVQEATGSRQASTQPVPSQPASQSMRPPPTQTQARPAFPQAAPPSQAPPPPTQPAMQARPQQSATDFPKMSDPLEVSKPLEIQRRPKTKKTQVIKPEMQATFVVNEETVLQGIIWNQILSEPRAKRSWRAVSRRR